MGRFSVEDHIIFCRCERAIASRNYHCRIILFLICHMRADQVIHTVKVSVINDGFRAADALFRRLEDQLYCSVKLVLYFVVGFASHLVLDCFNRKRVRILYPLPGGIALDFCKAGGFVDSLLFKLGSVAVIFEIVYLAVQMGESWKLFRM
mgnify:FL=1